MLDGNTGANPPEQSFEDGEIVTFCGTQFRVEVVSPSYRKLIPVTDPHWLLRHLERKTND